MKKILLLFILLIVLGACAGVKTTGNSMAEDLGSPKKIALLRERANDYWSAAVKGDYEKLFSLYDPFFQAANPGSVGLERVKGKIKYHNAEVKDVQVKGNIGTVKVSITYSVPPVTLKKLAFNQPETPAEFEETWLYIYDNWYKEYTSAMSERGVLEY
jgi:hypothetical protein